MVRPWARADGDTVLLAIHAQPGASRSEAAGEHGAALKIRLAAPPVDGKANAALIAFVAQRLDVPRSQVELIGGAASRQKRLRVTGVSLDAIDAAFPVEVALPKADPAQFRRRSMP
ncbi:MAG: YggU family protein [Sterolibacteriaceae bacterium]|nr:YggU family protein [Candidatus Methylophosphatis haderslevensis]